MNCVLFNFFSLQQQSNSRLAHTWYDSPSWVISSSQFPPSPLLMNPPSWLISSSQSPLNAQHKKAHDTTNHTLSGIRNRSLINQAALRPHGYGHRFFNSQRGLGPQVRSHCPISPPNIDIFSPLFRITCSKHVCGFVDLLKWNLWRIQYSFLATLSIPPFWISSSYSAPLRQPHDGDEPHYCHFGNAFFPPQSSSLHIGLRHKLTSWHHVWWMFHEHEA